MTMNESSRKLASDFLDSMPAGFYTYDNLCNLEMLLDNHAAEARAEQRHECEAAVARRLMMLQRTKGKFLTAGEHNSIAAACLNAVEKSDDGK